jgi:hypothetical protein
MGRALKRLAVLGAAVGGVVFFWRKKQARDQGMGPGPAVPPTASDKP